MIRAFLILALATLAAPAAAQSIKARPFDEGPSDPGFAAFRAALIEAVEAQDLDRVVAAASQDIHLDFGGGTGPDEFRARLISDPARYSEEYKHLAPIRRARYWAQLEWVLKNGGAFEVEDEASFAAPYTWMAQIPGDLDPYTTHFITGDNVVLRAGPSLEAAAIGRLDYDVVTGLEGPGIDREPGIEPGYARIRLADGREGWVSTRYLRSGIDYRAIFRRRDGRWQMTAFIAGD